MVGNGGWSTGAQIEKSVLPWHVRVLWPVSTAISGPALLLQKHFTGLVSFQLQFPISMTGNSGWATGAKN